VTVEREAVDEDDRLRGSVVLVVEVDGRGVLLAQVMNGMRGYLVSG
jgi:hypothetical protein